MNGRVAHRTIDVRVGTVTFDQAQVVESTAAEMGNGGSLDWELMSTKTPSGRLTSGHSKCVSISRRIFMALEDFGGGTIFPTNGDCLSNFDVVARAKMSSGCLQGNFFKYFRARWSIPASPNGKKC